MNTSNRSTSFSMPMPMPTSTPIIPSSPLLPSAPEFQPNQFTQFFKAEDANTSLPYPTTRLNCYYLRLDIKRDWHADYASKTSQKFLEMAGELENELKELLTVDSSFKLFLVHAVKDKWSHRRILLTFVMQTMVNFASEKFEELLKKHVKIEEKILYTRAFLRDFKVRKIDVHVYEHLVKFGCNPCTVCGEFDCFVIEKLDLMNL
jgi:transposase